MTGDEGRADAYARAARLIYVATCRDGAGEALDRAHRLAAKAVRRAGRHAGRRAEPDAADVLDDVLDEAVKLLLAEKPRRRWIRAVGSGIRPPVRTEDQRRSLERLASETTVQRLRLLRHVLDDAPAAEQAEQTWSGQQLADAETLLTAPELDPMIVPVDMRKLAGRRLRRRRQAFAALTTLAVAAAAGVWWFGIRTPPLGSYENDPVIQASPTRTDMGLDGWGARGELLGDADLLRRAANAWRRSTFGQPLPAGARPSVVFAGRVHGLRAVVLSSRGAYMATYSGNSYLAVYLEGVNEYYDPHMESNATSRLLVNPLDKDLPAPGGIRLSAASWTSADSILLPPGATNVRTGPLTTSAADWQPARPDARGVLDVPMPKDAEATVATQSRPSGGITYSGVSKYVTFTESDSAMLQETFTSASPVVPKIKADGHPITAREWCAIRRLAEAEGFADDPEAEWLKVSEVATGPLPDGGGTGSVIRMSARGLFGTDFHSDAVLELPDGSCAKASVSFPSALAKDFPASAVSVIGMDRPNQSSALATVDWFSSGKRWFLVVAAPDGVARLKVSGSTQGEADGRWLVVPTEMMADRSSRVEAFAGDGAVVAALEIAR